MMDDPPHIIPLHGLFIDSNHVYYGVGHRAIQAKTAREEEEAKATKKVSQGCEETCM